MTANWQWSIGPWKAGASTKTPFLGQGGPLRSLSTASKRSLQLRLRDPSSAKFTVWGYSPDAALVEELITDLWVYRNGTGLFRGRVVGPTEDTLDADRYDVAFEAVDYRDVLDRRILYADFTRTADQSSVVWDLIVDTQSQPGGDLGIAQAAGWPTTGVTRAATHKAGDTIWSSIKVLSGMGNGFDFDIDTDLKAQMYWPARGVDNGVNLDYGGAVTAVSRRFDPASYANAIRQSGADGTTPATATVDGIATTPEGRWDAQFGDTQLSTNQMVSDTWSANLARASKPLPAWTLKLGLGKWGGPGHVWLGDYVTVTVKAGRLRDIVKARVYGLDIDLDSSDQEQVSVIVGDERYTPEAALRGIAKRVQVLSKR